MTKNTFTFPVITQEERLLDENCKRLQSLIDSATLEAEAAGLNNMLSKKKKELVDRVHFKNKRTKKFCHCSDGRIKTHNPQMIANTEEELYEKLYEYYFTTSLTGLYQKWLFHEQSTKCLTNKTLTEYHRIWNHYILKSNLIKKNVQELTSNDFLKLFETWTGPGNITQKEFQNRKSLLNNILLFAINEGTIPYNPIQGVYIRRLKYKPTSEKKKGFYKDERAKLLSYVESLPEQDAYTYAIRVALNSVLRIGEIRGLSWSLENANMLHINKQIVDDRPMRPDGTNEARRQIAKAPKGNSRYSIREIEAPEAAYTALKAMKELNPDGKYLFMYKGRTLTTDTFNRRLQKYCAEAGIRYLSSHNIRFTNATLLYNAGVRIQTIQKLLGHSNLAMTIHYLQIDISDRASESDKIRQAFEIVDGANEKDKIRQALEIVDGANEKDKIRQAFEIAS